MKQTIRLKDFVEINPRVSLKKGEKYPFIEMGIVEPGRRYVKANQCRLFNTGGAKFLPNDVLFARITPCLENGKIAQYQDLHNRAGFGSTEFFVFRAREKISDAGYVYYIANSELIRKPAEKSMSGASGRQRADINSILNIDIPAPSLPTQRKIAAILSAYDDLIENNTRRIKILEEMAQNLYREWFVKFRFPGHEHARFVDSPLGRIPEGWYIREMQEVADVIDCLHSKKPQHNESGKGLLLQLSNIGDGGIIDLSKKYLLDEEDYKKWTSRVEVQFGDCVITNVGRVGAVAQIPKGLKAAIGRNMTAIRPHTNIMGPTYLIQYLLSPLMEREIQIKMDAGSIMDSLNVKGIIKLSVPIATPYIMKQFESIARPLREHIELLIKKNTTLRTTRDLLLPKLISGEVDVSDINIKVPVEVEA